MIPPNTTLVKFDNPLLISKNTDKRGPKDKKVVDSPVVSPNAAVVPCPTTIPRAQALDLKTFSSQQTIDALNSLIPPKTWTEGNMVWIQQVSSAPATRLDVIALQEDLDSRLKRRNARDTGICPVRRELYTECFDELIRQVTLNCVERGLMLIRVRDEIRMTIAAYQTLYESSIAFGMRKALQSEHGKAELVQKAMQLEADKKELDRQVNELKARCDQIEKRAVEQKAVDDKKHIEEAQFLKRSNQQLKTQLEGLIIPKK